MNRILPLALLLAIAPPAAAQETIRPGGRGEGVLGSAPAVWTFPGEAGQSYYISVGSDDFAPALWVGSSAGEECADCVSSDPAEGSESYAFVVFCVRRTGSYAIRVGARDAGGAGRYRLSMNHGIMTDPVDITRAVSLRDGETVAGELREGDGDWRGSYADVYTFQGQAGDTLVLAIQSADFAPFGMVEFAATGEYVGANDFGFDRELVVELPYDGVYAIHATSERTGQTGRYTVSARRRP